MTDKVMRSRFFARFGEGTPSKLKSSIDVLQRHPLKSFVLQNQSSMVTRLSPVDDEEWLLVDWTYLTFHSARSNILKGNASHAIQYWNNDKLANDIENACKETLEMVVGYLTKKYPKFFCKKGSEIQNIITGEKFNMNDGKTKPLEIAARLVNEDLNILLPVPNSDNKGEATYNYHLAASATLFPAGWVLKERIGWTVQELHKPVPGWDKKLGTAVPNALRKIALGSTPTGKIAPGQERLAVFPQADQPDKALGELLFAQDGDYFFPEHLRPVRADRMIFRRERQCFLRLPKVKGVLFTVHTYVCYLDEMEAQEAAGLARQTLTLPESHASYKQRDVWYPCLRNYCKERGVDIDNKDG